MEMRCFRLEYYNSSQGQRPGISQPRVESRACGTEPWVTDPKRGKPQRGGTIARSGSLAPVIAPLWGLTRFAWIPRAARPRDAGPLHPGLAYSGPLALSPVAVPSEAPAAVNLNRPGSSASCRL